LIFKKIYLEELRIDQGLLEPMAATIILDITLMDNWTNILAPFDPYTDAVAELATTSLRIVRAYLTVFLLQNNRFPLSTSTLWYL
jgi:hypothetical protein